MEFLAEDVGDEAIVAELHQLPAEPDFEIGHAHHGRDEHHRRPRLTVAAAHENTFQLLTLELPEEPVSACSLTSFASSASLATVFMLRAVPTSFDGSRIFDVPIPLG